MPPRHLVLFATSDAPDPYINWITHAIVHVGVTSVEIVVISDTLLPCRAFRNGVGNTYIRARGRAA